jgi:RNA polymerase sigma-70 factor (ECF subfamily)
MTEKSQTSQIISALYKQLGRPVMKLILKRNGGDLAAAESIVQDTFIAAYKSFHTFHHKSTYFTWLCRIALNKMADYYRQQVHQKSHFVAPALEELTNIFSPDISPEERLSLSELQSQINKCLDLLPLEYRQLLHLKYYEQLSSKEICLKLHIAPRSLEGKLYRARKSLAAVISSASPDLKG